MGFVTAKDYEVLITAEQLGQITTDSDNINVCLEQSEEEVKEYLRHRFDVELDMREVVSFADSTSVTATAGQRLQDATDLKMYLCVADATGAAITDPAFFKEGDDRNAKLVQIVVDVFLYHLHTRLNPRNIPAHRKIRYDGDGEIKNSMNAIAWLLMVQKGTITPNLTPRLDDTGEQLESGQSIQYGDSKKADTYGGRNSYYTGN